MSSEKKGGARLDTAASKKTNAPIQDPRDPGKPDPLDGMKEHKLSKRQIVLIVLAALLGTVLLIGVVACQVHQSLVKLPDLPDLPPVEAPTPDPVTGVVPSEKPLSDRKEGFYTFLVVGRDTGGGGNTDTIMLASYDINNQKLSVMSIPRDTMVDPHHPDRNHRINAVWNLGLYYAEKGSDKKGIDYLKEAVGEMLGFTPDFYVIVNWEAFGRLVDAIGGVDFDVPFEMKYNDPTQDLVIDQAAGHRHLTGDDAMQIVRWRHDNSFTHQYADADLGRIRTQQALMKEIVKSCLQINNMTKIREFADIFTEEVETDLTTGNLAAFAERAILGGLEMENVEFMTVPVTGVYVNKDSYVQVKPEETIEMVNTYLNPYRKDLTPESMHLLQYSTSAGYYLYRADGTTAKPTNSAYQPPVPTPTPAATPAATSEPSEAPASSEPQQPSDQPEPSESPEPAETGTPAPDDSPEASPAPTPDASAEPTDEPGHPEGIPID